jgi:protein involved in polysaccharide export with SLBB domain
MEDRVNMIWPKVGIFVFVFFILMLMLSMGQYPRFVKCDARKTSGTLGAPAQASGRQQPRQQQSSQSQLPTAPSMPNVIISPDEDYRIGPSDVVEINVQDAPELSGMFRVSAAGTFNLPFLGKIMAQQKTTEELAKFIADGLRKGYLRDPQVAISVKEINSRSFFIQGAVRRPGLYQIEGRPTLLKFITIAGGLSDNYGSTAFIIRETKQSSLINEANAKDVDQATATAAAGATVPEDRDATTNSSNSSPDQGDHATYELVKANINNLLKGNFDQNVLVYPGDIVHIPPTDIFFVSGEVIAPGSFPLKDGTTLRQAISLAQGTNFQAATERGIIFRENPISGKRQEIRVDIGAVMNGKKEDVPIAANDIIIIPNSRMKTVTGTLLRAFGVNAPRILIPGRY